MRTGEAQDSRLKTRKLGTFSHRIVASPAYLAAWGTPLIPEDLAQHACHRHRFPSTGAAGRRRNRDGTARDQRRQHAGTSDLPG
ncbi:LysR substrate-binding domain-containing protein [Starkeya nomas]|uniref:LysR substrate-binding domain-containing protein n=1 Tax=Starkeya nomas TaxID=2666134 RepID=UPI0028056B49|nr:LysR substrate-binding domain-containing protein [Starkeya nomas]